jgi:hypothetical protein
MLLQVKNHVLNWARWFMTVNALRRLRQEDLQFKASLGYMHTIN